MAKPLVSDALWQHLEALLPAPKPRRFRFPGRRPFDFRKILTGLIFILKTGIDWEELRQRGIEPRIPKRRTEHGSGLGIYRWVVERTESWLHNFGKLRVRTDPDGLVHRALVSLGSALLCLGFL